MPSFPEDVSWTHMTLPHSGISCRTGISPITSSYGDIPAGNAHVQVQFFNHTACMSALPQSPRSDWLDIIIAQTFLIKVWFNLSATPLCSGVSCTVNFCSIPFLSKKAVNVSERYLLPQSVCKHLTCFSSCVKTQA